MSKKVLNVVQTIALISILGLAIYVVFAPNVVYAPTSRIVLFLLVALLPAILLGAKGATTKVDVKLPTFLISATGAAALFLAALFFLDYLSKPEEKIAVYEIIDEKGEPLAVDWDGAIKVSVTERGLSVTKFVDGNTVILIFPEQVGQAEMQVKKSPLDVTYTGHVNYAGTRTLKLKLGDELKSNQR